MRLAVLFLKMTLLKRNDRNEGRIYNGNRLDGTIPGKPEPDIYRKAAENISTNIEECAVFEDAKSGIEAARRAGAGRIIGVASMLEEERLFAYGAEATIKNYSNIDCFLMGV